MEYCFLYFFSSSESANKKIIINRIPRPESSMEPIVNNYCISLAFSSLSSHNNASNYSQYAKVQRKGRGEWISLHYRASESGSGGVRVQCRYVAAIAFSRASQQLLALNYFIALFTFYFRSHPSSAAKDSFSYLEISCSQCVVHRIRKCGGNKRRTSTRRRVSS